MEITVTQIAGRPGPIPVLDVTVSLRSFRNGPMLFLGLSGHAEYMGHIVSDHVQFEPTYWPSAPSTLMRREEHAQGRLVVPLGSRAIGHIEGHRGDQDVPLSIRLRYFCQEVVEIPDGSTGQKQIFAGTAYSDTTSPGCVIKRSDWLKRLAEMGWQEYELFEIAKQPLLPDKNLSVALDRLQEAQTALRNGDYTSVLAKCRSAFESAAKHEVPDDVKRGFESLLARVFGSETKRPELLNSVIDALSSYAHLGRHEQYPAVAIGREEAEFVFTTTVSVFSLVSRLLGREK